MNVLFALLTWLYCLFLVWLERGVSKICRINKDKIIPAEKQSISIIVAAKNELDNLPALLESLSRLDYPKDCFEIILVNDHSTDGSSKYLRSQQQCLEVNVIEFTGAIEGLVGKKAAIQTGINAAKFDVLAFTDADCLVPDTWLQEINRVFDSGTDYLLAYSLMKRQTSDGIFRLKNFERSIYYALAAAGLNYRIPFTSSACNMVYRKSLFEQSGGFMGIGNLLSGDDDLLLMKMMPFMRKSAYNPSPKMQVTSIDGTDRAKHHQTNIRRASKFRYHPWWLKGLSAFVFVYFIMFYRSLWLLITGKASRLLSLSLILKTTAEYFLTKRHLKQIGRSELAVLYPVQILLFPAQFIFYALRGTLGKFKWK
ncbi:MAG: glycosyltransferase [Candidatus Cloacimonas sp.]|jgi:glycosyltransferase involved in cell wall biosynthesis|nr:glycosyltransferase [Candidatus Cloacimonas sp.]